MTIPLPPPRSSEPAVRDMSNAELRTLVEAHHPYRGKAVFELAARAGTDEAAATSLGELSRLPALRTDRVFHLVSLAWAAIVGLLAAETAQARQIAYTAFYDLDVDDQTEFLAYLKAGTIEDAHPRL